jgi:hypothetical protein
MSLKKYKNNKIISQKFKKNTLITPAILSLEKPLNSV